MNCDNIRIVLSYCKPELKLFQVFGSMYLDIFYNSKQYISVYTLRCYQNKQETYDTKEQECIYNFWNVNKSTEDSCSIRFKRKNEQPFIYYFKSPVINSLEINNIQEFGIRFLDVFEILQNKFVRRNNIFVYDKFEIRFINIKACRYLAFKDNKSESFLYIDEQAAICSKFFFKAKQTVSINVTEKVTASELIKIARTNYGKLLNCNLENDF